MKEIADILLKEKAVFLRPDEPFTWTSGIKSPVYCDNRLLISSVESRKKIIRAFVDLIKPMKPTAIAGTATAGIPWAAWIADEMDLPLVYIRGSSKEHGRKNAIEGQLHEGSQVVLIEDLISTGKSSIEAGEKIREAGHELICICSIFTYGFSQAVNLFEKNKMNVLSLTSFDILAQVAYDDKIIPEESLSQVLHWRKGVIFP